VQQETTGGNKRGPDLAAAAAGSHFSDQKRNFSHRGRGGTFPSPFPSVTPLYSIATRSSGGELRDAPLSVNPHDERTPSQQQLLRLQSPVPRTGARRRACTGDQRACLPARARYLPISLHSRFCFIRRCRAGDYILQRPYVMHSNPTITRHDVPWGSKPCIQAQTVTFHTASQQQAPCCSHWRYECRQHVNRRCNNVTYVHR
jgi:hypothetical protein